MAAANAKAACANSRINLVSNHLDAGDLRAESARRRGHRNEEAATRAEAARVVAALAASLPDDDLRRTLYAAARA